MPGKAFKANSPTWRRGQSVGSASSPSYSPAEGGAGSSTAAASASAHELKRAKKQADSYVAQGVAIQDKLDNDANAGASERLAALDSAIGFYDQALRLSPRHADASYNWAVATIEKLELAPHISPDGTLLFRCIDLLEGVIAADTSRRGETAGLCHRAVANAILENFEALKRLKGLDDKRMLDKIKNHFEEALKILSSFGDIGSYYVEFSRYYRLYLERLLLDDTLPAMAKLDLGRQLSIEFNGLVSKVLQSGSTGDADVDLIIERSTVLAEYVQAAVDLSASTGGAALPGLETLVESLQEDAKALLALAADEEEAYDAARESLEVLIRHSQFIGDPLSFVGNCNSLLSSCENSCKLFYSASFLADLGGSLFVVASSLSRFPAVLNILASMSENISSMGAAESSSVMATGCSALLGTLSRAACSINERITLPERLQIPPLSPGTSVPDVVREALMLAHTVYRACIYLSESQPEDRNFSRDDMNVVFYNMACIGWLVGDEDACRRMLSEYLTRAVAAVAATAGSQGVLDKLAALRSEAASDEDLAGVHSRAWFAEIGLV